MATHAHKNKVTIGSRSIEGGGTYTSGGIVQIDGESIPIATDTAYACAIDVSAVKSCLIMATVACTVETNSGSAADDTIVLKANIPYVWNTDAYDTFLLGTDVTVLYVTNASGAVGALYVEVLQDVTP